MKKYLAMLLALAMMLGCLAGCGSTGNNDQTSSENNSAQSENVQPDASTDAVQSDDVEPGSEDDTTLPEVELIDPLGPTEFPTDATIVCATKYSVHTKTPASLQDAVIQATMYWDITNNELFAISFLQPMLPWDDNNAAYGWGCVTDEALLATLSEGDGLVEFAEDIKYAKYLEIGGILWTGELGSYPAAEAAVVYSAEINGTMTTINDYVATQEGGRWYVEASQQPVKILTAAGDLAAEYEITYKETNGHGTHFWLSDITFPGNIEAIKSFVAENGFEYSYYADGGITQNEEGYWQSVDAVSGATLDETPTYLDVLKDLYNEIQAGNYVVVSEAAN